MITVLLYSLIGGLFSLTGGLVLTWKAHIAKKITTTLLAFAAGAFLAVSFLDILPEAIELAEDPHPILLAALGGFIAFFMLERYLMKLNAHSEDHAHSEHTEALPTLIILGDSIHNFLDGIVIALAFIAHPAAGLVTAIGIAAHEIPQEIADFSILLSQGWSRKKVIVINVLQSLLTIPGALIGYYAGVTLEPLLPYLLAGASGIFLYIAASDLIPEIHHRTGHKGFFRVVLPLAFAIISIGILIEVTHG